MRKPGWFWPAKVPTPPPVSYTQVALGRDVHPGPRAHARLFSTIAECAGDVGAKIPPAQFPLRLVGFPSVSSPIASVENCCKNTVSKYYNAIWPIKLCREEYENASLHPAQ